MSEFCTPKIAPVDALDVVRPEPLPGGHRPPTRRGALSVTDKFEMASSAAMDTGRILRG
jgi:hypothetical protein